MSERRNILVIKLGALGDIIQAFGAMAAIRKHHPDDRIILLTTPPYAGLAAECGYCDEIWTEGRPRLFDISGWSKLKMKLSGEHFARVYDLQNNDRTAVYLRMFPARSRPEWVGAAPGASHRNDSPARTAGHALDGHAQTLGLVGITHVAVDTLGWMKADIAHFPLRRPYVLLVPGASPQHPDKRWPAASYARLATILAQTGYQPVIIGTAHDLDAAAVIERAAVTALNLCGQTSLAQLAPLARGAAGAVGNDTGPMHLIAATGCPVLSLFSKAGNPARHAPKGERVTVLQTENLETLKPEKVLQLFRPRETPARNNASVH